MSLCVSVYIYSAPSRPPSRPLRSFQPSPQPGPQIPAIEATNLLFYSTIVASGHGRGIVIGTGDNTVMGQVGLMGVWRQSMTDGTGSGGRVAGRMGRGG